VRDVAANVQVNDSSRTLSTSQANALAVALFLAFNLGLQPTTLAALVLDDPLRISQWDRHGARLVTEPVAIDAAPLKFVDAAAGD